MINKRNKIILTILVFAVAGLGVFVWRTSPSFKKAVIFWEKPKVVTDTFAPPQTERITGAEGKLMERDKAAYPIPLVPKGDQERVVVVGAELTLKNAYELSSPEAKKWAVDAKLVFIKSLGSVDLAGRSSAWQIGFGSKNKKRGYEIIIQGHTLVSQKETSSGSYGVNLPKNWYDSKEVIISVQTLPQFSHATITGLDFFYNTDGKVWMYSLVTSLGAYTTPVK